MPTAHEVDSSRACYIMEIPPFSQVVIPLFLTAVLFLGPVVMASVNDVRIKLIMMPHYWSQSIKECCHTELPCIN